MGRDGLSVVEKIGLILERFIERRTTALTFNEILSDSPLSRATTHRLLTDLAERGLLAQDAQRDEYRLGPVLLCLAGIAQELTGAAERALPKMELLRDQFGETMLLAELHEGAVVPVQRLDGLHEMRMTQQVGRSYPAYAGATGKVLLAHLDPESLTTYLAGVHVEPLTEATITSVEELRLDLTRIQQLGVAVSAGERIREAIAVAAPIFGSDGRVSCALAISGLASRFDRDRMLLAAQAVKDAADGVSCELGFHPTGAEPTGADLKDPAGEPYQALVEMCDDAVHRKTSRALSTQA